MSIKAIAAALAAMCISGQAGAFFDDFDKLEGKAIVLASEFEQITCPPFSKYECLTWPSNLLKSKKADVCISVDFMVSCSLGCKGLIVSDREKNLSLFVLEEGYRSQFKQRSFEQLRCPTTF